MPELFMAALSLLEMKFLYAPNMASKPTPESKLVLREIFLGGVGPA